MNLGFDRPLVMLNRMIQFSLQTDLIEFSHCTKKT